MALKESARDIEGVREQLNVSEKLNSELDILKNISPSKNLFKLVFDSSAHLTELKSAFQRGNVSYTMFDWAGGGNLYQFWHGKDLETVPALDVFYWIQDQIEGLISALHALHYLFECRHGDLKRDNILVFDLDTNGLGRLAIADFRLIRVHEDATQSLGRATKFM
jgi:serine/threonine protein kinase